MIFLPPHPTYTAEIDGYTKIDPKSEQPVAAIHLKAQPNAPTIIYSHGNAEDIGCGNMEVFKALNQRGFGVIAYDYPGYGLTPGTSSEKSTQQAIQSTWDYAINSGIPASSIIILGRSIGSGPSVWLATHTKPAGLILISPLKSAYCVAFGRPIFPGDRFPNYKRINDTDAPLLVIHGELDDIIPYSHGQELYQKSPSRLKKFVSVKKSGHNDLYPNALNEVLDAVTDFIHQLPKE
jgi:pimeloyl-ACP methyl ester carboxylesterase